MVRIGIRITKVHELTVQDQELTVQELAVHEVSASWNRGGGSHIILLSEIVSNGLKPFNQETLLSTYLICFSSPVY
jgi:hypothetical protein